MLVKGARRGPPRDAFFSRPTRAMARPLALLQGFLKRFRKLLLARCLNPPTGKKHSEFLRYNGKISPQILHKYSMPSAAIRLLREQFFVLASSRWNSNPPLGGIPLCWQPKSGPRLKDTPSERFLEYRSEYPVVCDIVPGGTRGTQNRTGVPLNRGP